MGLDSCMKCIKYTLFIFNFFFWLIGVLILGFGLYLLIEPIAKTEKLLGEADPVYPMRLTLIVIGSVVMLLGFLGCCGAILENKCMLLTFFILMTLVFLALVVAGLLVVFMREKAKDHLSKNFEENLEVLFRDYKNTTDAMNTTEAIQKVFQCCGIKGVQDYTTRVLTVPDSCKDLEKEGCVKKLQDHIDDHWQKIVIVIFSVAAVTLLGMILSILLCCALRDEYDY